MAAKKRSFLFAHVSLMFPMLLCVLIVYSFVVYGQKPPESTSAL
jgi:hypothetical protein